MTRASRWAVSTALALLAALAGSVPSASAGTYMVFSCTDRAGGHAPIADADGGWSPESGPAAASGLNHVDQCTQGNGFAANVGGAQALAPDYVWAQWTFRPPSDVRISAFDVSWSGYAVPTGASKAGYVNIETEDGRYSNHVAGGPISLHATTAAGLDAEYIRLHAGCDAGNVSCGATSEGGDARIHVTRAEITLSDPYAPTGSAAGEALQRSTWLGPQLALVDGADRGSGVATVSATVDGVAAGSAVADAFGGRCQTRGGPQLYGSPRPCNTDPAAAELTVDPRPFADGEHVVRFLVTDASGAASVVATQTKTFDTHPPALSGRAEMTGSGREGQALTCAAPVPDGQSPTVAFSWTRANADGSGRTPIAGATQQTYTPVAADVGRKLLCTFAATDGGGTATSESLLTDGPFSDGRTVRGFCDGVPAGPKDPCGDLDNDGVRNRDDVDADDDGVARDQDPDDLDGARTGRDAPPPATSTTTTTTTTTTTERNQQSEIIRDGAPGEPNGRFASPSATLTSHHEGTSSRTLRVRHGRPVIIEGRLLAPDGRGIAGAKLDITTQDRVPGVAFVDAGAVLTEEDGRYRVRLAAGPSRTVRIGYRARFGDTSFAQTTDLTVLVRAGVQFRLSATTLRNGRTVRFSGKVLGPRSGHRFAEVQVRVGRRWIVVCSVRTDAKGSFACRHRFTKTFKRTRYVFRARVRRQAALPYEPATTRSRSLVVRP